MPRYIITLHELLAHTPHDHVERKSLENARRQLEDLSRQMHDEVCKHKIGLTASNSRCDVFLLSGERDGEPAQKLGSGADDRGGLRHSLGREPSVRATR